VDRFFGTQCIKSIEPLHAAPSVKRQKMLVLNACLLYIQVVVTTHKISCKQN